MVEYTSLGHFEIKGRGVVYYVEYNGDTIYKDKVNYLVGDKIMIDGHVFVIKEVETYALGIITKGHIIGLLV